MESAVVCGEVVVYMKRFWKVLLCVGSLLCNLKGFVNCCGVWGGCGVLRRSFGKCCGVWGGCCVFEEVLKSVVGFGNCCVYEEVL